MEGAAARAYTVIVENADKRTIAGFDSIWRSYGGNDAARSDEPFEMYFSIFPREMLNDAEGFELGCGNGRIARSVAARAGLLHCIEPTSGGIAASKRTMAHASNVRFHEASADRIPLPDGSQDFGYSIGVLHHIPDPQAGLRACVRKLKPGAPFLLYVYYSLDNRPAWFRAIWQASDVARRAIARLPFPLRYGASTFMAAAAYWPLSRAARLAGKVGLPTRNIPLSLYAHRPWHDLRADSLDRFGTAVEHRFSKAEIETMMTAAGLTRVRFAEGAPYWVALGFKALA